MLQFFIDSAENKTLTTVNSPSDAAQLPLTAAAVVDSLDGSYFGSLRRLGGGARDLTSHDMRPRLELWVLYFVE